MRVQITKLPIEKAAYGKQVQGALSLKPGAFGGADYKATSGKSYGGVRGTVDEVPRDEANLEAEGGETAFGPITGQSIPDHLKIKGKRHHEGGVPLNLPDDTFIFSDTASLRINDPSVLAMFNKIPKKGGYTPAEIAKPYNINKYKSILLDPDTSKLERDTATIMIKNYIMKLGALALVQESMKGFPQGIPEMAKPYMEANGIAEEDLMPELKEQADALAQAMDQGVNPQMPQEQNPMAAQEMQQMAPEQAMQADQVMMNEGQGEPSYPQQMPDGAPVASPDTMAQMSGQGSMPPPDMMQQPGMMAFGGIPYAEYGMQMGGFDFPYYPDQMAYGGVPKFDGTNNSQVAGNPGGPGGPGRQPGHRVVKPDEYKSYQGATYSDDQGEYKYRSYRDKVEGRKEYNPNQKFSPSSGPFRGDLCRDMKTKGTFAYGKSATEVLKHAFAHHYVKDQNGVPTDEVLPKWAATNAQWKTKLENCEIEAAREKKETVSTEQPGETPCLCLNADGSVYKDAEGNTKEAPKDENGVCQPNDPSCGGETETVLCRCTDPVTGEVKEFPVENEEQCICQDGSRGQAAARGDSPHLSKRSRLDIARNALMQTGVERDNVVLPGRAQIEGAYEEYQTKVDTAQSAVNALQNAVMNGMAGATGAKQAQMKDLLGKSLRSSMDAVANVQSRNVDRQRETNVQEANIDNANMAARAHGLQAALTSQKDSRNQERANKNKRLYNTFGATMAGLDRMAQLQQVNTTSPQYNADYEDEFVYHTGVQKPLTGATSASLEDRTNYYLSKTGDYDKAWDKAYKEARLYQKSRMGGQRLANGGYVLASNVFPFIL